MPKFYSHPAAKVLLACLSLLIAWQIVRADDAPLFVPAYEEQVQARKLTSLLLDSEAERAMVTYLPGKGMVVSLDLIRGPNSLRVKTADEGTLDWVVFLLSDLIGPELAALPANETVTVAVDFYDYRVDEFRQLVVEAPIETYENGNSYDVWLDGERFVTELYVEDLSESGASEVEVTATPLVEALIDEMSSFADPNATAQWLPISGEWQFADGVYLQTDELNFDRISFFDRPVTDSYTYTLDLQYRAGSMAGGAVFNAEDPQFRANSHMASYTNDGSFFQWGYFADDGNFVFQGGAPVEEPRLGNDGAWHQLTIVVDESSYSIYLDNVELASAIPLEQVGGGYFGLFSSTSRVAFREVTIDGVYR